MTLTIGAMLLPASAVAAPPGNDDVANAVVWTGQTSFIGTNAEATKETGEPDHAGNPGGASIWYTGTPTFDGAVTVDTCGSDFDTVLAVYRATGPVPPFSNLVPVAGNDDSCGLQSSLNFTFTAGSTYYIAVDGFGGDTGNVSLNLTLGGPPSPGPGPPTPTPPEDGGFPGLPEANCAADGRFAGTTSQGEKICFNLAGKRVQNLQFTIHASCSSGSLEQYSQFTKALLAFKSLRNHKVRKFDFFDGELEVTGKIKKSSAKGILELDSSGIAGFCHSGVVGWSAQKG